MPSRDGAARVISLVTVAVLIGACTPLASSPTPARPTPTVVAPTATVAPSPSPATGWRPVPVQAVLHEVRLTHVIRVASRFVALGEAGQRVVAFDSDDGLAWHRGTDLGSQDDVAVAALAAGPHGVAAVGGLSNRPVSWASVDGLTWTSRPAPFPMPALGTDTATVTDIAAAGDGWIAVGREDPACTHGCDLDPVRALVWSSDDGLTWTRVARQPALEGGGMESIVRTADGFVAAGIAASQAVVWTSPDGMTWSRVPDAPVFHPQPDTDPNASVGMERLAMGRGVVVGLGTALGVGDGGAPAAVGWWSADGRTWEAANVAEASPDYALSLAATSDGFIATGSTVNGNDWVPIIWRSADGHRWDVVTADAAPDGFDPASVAAAPAIEVAVGAAGPTGPAWWRPVP